MTPASISLLCLPWAGASATRYLRWRRLLPAWIRVVPVELPGRGARVAEAFIEDFDELVVDLCKQQAEVLHGRYALFGHSMGALLAYGMTVYLRERLQPMPQALLVSGSPAPSRRDPDRYASKGDAALIADLRQQGGTPVEIFDNAEMMRITLDVLGADYRVCESFRYCQAKPLSVPVHAFGGRDDDIETQCLEAWQQEAAGASSVDWFDGGHFFIHQHESKVLPAIVQRMATEISRPAYASVATA